MKIAKQGNRYKEIDDPYTLKNLRIELPEEAKLAEEQVPYVFNSTFFVDDKHRLCCVTKDDCYGFDPSISQWKFIRSYVF